MFYGQFDRTFDDKNRVMIPAKFREQLTSVVFVSLGLEDVLELRSEAEWNKFASELNSKSEFDRNVRTFKRAYFARTQQLEIDKQGRIMVPQTFINLAAIGKNLVFVGVGNKVEIWDKAKFERFQNENPSEKLETLAQAISDKGF
ncbi:cell division protein MraZ [Mycoplasmopsis californica]|uniref:Transcriptional regulator MraZ n=1 Tax=Mycoplasmopsis equigenitalium TaxID=114883 RepID=A0ABY5J091_9BACT|nr:division/cell wall cluster transcriptional repressor MraZ [Mycoplasmopsis equigenitalium]UUD36672.1 division/cell wall cluster transcriptional repressor MraZ [Mycoplasmopsis equigenitalium]VEU69366.1 cell division protein MraZ [Mycoplasmopsis californica]